MKQPTQFPPAVIGRPAARPAAVRVNRELRRPQGAAAAYAAVETVP
jgi:hypothetical protein